MISLASEPVFCGGVDCPSFPEEVLELMPYE
jgi:hypothetical protein